MTKRLKQNVLQGLLMAAAVAAALPVPDLAWAAGGGLGSSVSNITTNQILNIPNLIAACFYIGGTALIGAGLLKLKSHSENPGQTPISHGVGRIAVGAALLTVPLFGTWVLSTLFNGGEGGAAGYTQMNAITGP